MKAYAMIQSVILYFVLFVLRVLIVLFGFIVVPLAYCFRSGDHFSKLFWLWDNDEDGVYGPHWFNEGNKGFKVCYLWSAVRNPANNMRFVSLFNVEHKQGIRHEVHGFTDTPDPSISRRLGNPVWHLTLVRQHGLWYFSYWYLRARKNGTHFRFRIGWKCTPEWITKPRAEIYKYSGMTFQFMPYRKG